MKEWELFFWENKQLYLQQKKNYDLRSGLAKPGWKAGGPGFLNRMCTSNEPKQSHLRVSDLLWLIGGDLQQGMCGVLYACLWRGLTLYLGCGGTYYVTLSVLERWHPPDLTLLGAGVTTEDGTLPSQLTSDHTFCFPRKTRKGRLSLRFKIPYEKEEISRLCWGH